jgi:hypothetical protein
VIDLETETILPLHDAPRHALLRRGRRPGRPIHRSTIERWHTRGVGGVKLETVKLGGIRATTVEALRRFLDRVSGNLPPDAPTPSGDRKAHEAAERELAAAGL